MLQFLGEKIRLNAKIDHIIMQQFGIQGQIVNQTIFPQSSSNKF